MRAHIFGKVFYFIFKLKTKIKLYTEKKLNYELYKISKHISNSKAKIALTIVTITTKIAQKKKVHKKNGILSSKNAKVAILVKSL
jgi:hypothetical protein